MFVALWLLERLELMGRLWLFVSLWLLEKLWWLVRLSSFLMLKMKRITLILIVMRFLESQNYVTLDRVRLDKLHAVMAENWWRLAKAEILRMNLSQYIKLMQPNVT